MPAESAFSIPSSPLAALGTISILIAFLVAAYAVAAGIVGNVQKRPGLVRSSVYSLYALCAIMTLASALIVYAFVTHDYSIKYVTMYSDTAMPLIYKLTAYWGGLDGSLMFWVFVLSVFSAIAVATNHRRHKDMIGYVVGTICIVQLFFLALLIYSKNPFTTWLTEAPIDGKGLNPLLQTYWMVIHPPALYLGFIAATIPFAFGIAAMASGRLDNQWMHSVRVWTFLCWFFLSFGLLLGGRWAYEELGWGGYWAWDPVENAGLLPWFTATAFLHSIIIQEQRGMLRVWNMLLVILTFFLTIFGTFMTRSGIVQSVHAFGEDNELALLFVLFMLVFMVISVGLLIWRLPQLRAKNQFESFLSKEFAFLLNNWILLGSAFFVLFATLFPTISEAITGERMTVGPPFFNMWMTPIALTLLFLAGAAPLLAWRRTTGKRLFQQFTRPSAIAVVCVVLLASIWAVTRVLSPMFIEKLRLPLALANFGIIAFVLASVGQEFWGGMRVRMKQTGGDPLTSVIGIIAAKRRKYGGYIIHVGMAVMFIGFAGKCFTVEENFSLAPGDSYTIRDYTLNFDRVELDDTNSDLMMRSISHLTISKGGEPWGKMAPEVRNYTKSEQPVHEIDVITSFSPGNDFFEDFYVVFNHYDKERMQASFAVFINPLINWVWTGFLFLTLGTILCLIPYQRFAKLGGAAAVILLVSMGGMPTATAATEHASTHVVDGGAAGEYRENYPPFLVPYRTIAIETLQKTQPQLQVGSDAFEMAIRKELQPIVDFNRELMKRFRCMCGCPKESVYHCTCGNAANERKLILNMLQVHNLSTPEGREKAKADITAQMIQRFASPEDGDGTHVLLLPPNTGGNQLTWAIPYLALAGGMLLIFTVARRWVRSGQQEMVNNLSESMDVEEDEDYGDILDDELRDIDK